MVGRYKRPCGKGAKHGAEPPHGPSGEMVARPKEFAGHAVLTGLISSSDFVSAGNFTNWYQDNSLVLNATKTKEMDIGFRKNKTIVEPLVINNKEIKIHIV